MGYQKITPEEVYEILIAEDKFKLLIDSNVLMAYLDENHKFHYEASVIIDPLKKQNCYFFLHYIVIGEFISQWMEYKESNVEKAISLIKNFSGSLKFSLNGGRPLTTDLIFSSLRKHSKHKNFLKAHFNDFLILAEAENIKNIKIVTCDKAMCDAGKNIFKKNIYYLPFQTKKGKSELRRFIQDMEQVSFRIS